MFKNFLRGIKPVHIGIYLIVAVILSISFMLLVKVMNINTFFNVIENKTFDFRQAVLVANKSKKPNKDIVIVTIDDASYEFLLNKYGEWPIPRSVYADLINYIEKQSPKAISFDLMFVNSMKSNPTADLKLITAMNKYDNVLTAINFDDQDEFVRKPADLPNRMKLTVDNKSKQINFDEYLTFNNCRLILPELINGSVKIGSVNVVRSDDGILRKMPAIVNYKGEFYPHLSLLTGLQYFKDNKIENIKLTKNSNLIVNTHTIPLDTDGGAIINWYGHAGKTYKYIPMYQLILAMEQNKVLSNFDMKDKIVLFGTTATSLHDAKSVPISNMGEVYPGVEIYATYINNIIDNNFIKKTSTNITILISILLAIIIGAIVFTTSSTIVALGSTALILLTYLLATYYIMMFANLWVAIVMPVFAVLIGFATAYILKYIVKSRDFDYQYKLATTDGLTELYNHRYFQDQMKMQIEHCKRYDSKFSLIIVDIDFFKKFNDTYGHQAGDAVLKQVAQTLKKNSRSTDIVCRYGGEEMSIILTNTDKEDALFNAQRICSAVSEKPFKLNATQESHVTISLGVATFPQDGSTPQEMIETSDKGLYWAKEHGRNQVGRPELDEQENK